MTPKKRGRKQKNMPCERLTERVLTLSAKSIDECIRQEYDVNGNPQPGHLYWTLGMSASMLSCAKAILVLLDSKRLHECQSLQRNLFESMINIQYVLKDPGCSKDRHKMWADYQIRQENDQIELIAQITNTTAAALAMQHPRVRESREKLETARGQTDSIDEMELQRLRTSLGERHQEVAKLAADVREGRKINRQLVLMLAQTEIARKKTTKASRPRSWRDITMAEKITTIFESKQKPIIDYHFLMLNAFVHGGMGAIDCFIPRTKRGMLRPTHGPVRDREGFRKIWFLTMDFLLRGITEVVRSFDLSGLSEELGQLHNEVHVESRRTKLSSTREVGVSRASRPGGQASNNG